MKSVIDCPKCGHFFEIEVSVSRLELLDIDPVDFAPWSARVERILRANKIDTMEKLLQMSANALLILDGFGPASLAEVRAVLAQNGLCLSGEISNAA